MPTIEQKPLHRLAQSRAHPDVTRAEEQAQQLRIHQLYADMSIFVGEVNTMFAWHFAPQHSKEGLVPLLIDDWEDTTLPAFVKDFLRQEAEDNPKYKPAIMTKGKPLADELEVHIGFVDEHNSYESSIYVRTMKDKGPYKVHIRTSTVYQGDESAATQLVLRRINAEFVGDNYATRERSLVAADQIFDFALRHVLPQLHLYPQQ